MKLQNIKIIKLIKDAINDDGIVSYFQPIINNKSGQIEKYESLVRLISNKRVYKPAYFLDIAKEEKYYHEITHIILVNSLNILLKCDQEISINISIKDIENINTQTVILKLIDKYKEYAHRIIFEILEDEDTKDHHTIVEFITKLKIYGIKVALDDFGTGHSNFERILYYKPDILKIDASLIKNIDTDPRSQSIVRSIFEFASKEGIETIAEGVDSMHVQQVVSEIGICYSQGFYFGAPVPMDLTFKPC